MWLFLLLILVPLIEIGLFITVGGWLTLWPTLAIVLATGVLGAVLLRVQGRQVLLRLQRGGSLAETFTALGDGVLIVIGGILLMTPGFLTDTLGLLLMLPPVRSLLRRVLQSRIRIVTPQGGFGPDAGQGPASAYDIDGSFREVPPTQPDSRPSGWTRP